MLESQLYCHAKCYNKCYNIGWFAQCIDLLCSSTKCFSSDLQIYFSGKFSRRSCQIVPVASVTRHPTCSSSFTDLKKLPKNDLKALMVYQTASQAQMSCIIQIQTAGLSILGSICIHVCTRLHGQSHHLPV